MIGWSFDSNSLKIVKDEQDNISAFSIQVNGIKIVIEPFDWDEADKRVATALLIIILRYKKEIMDMLMQNKIHKIGEYRINIFKFSSYKEAFSKHFPYDGLTMDDVKKIVERDALMTMLAPNTVLLIVRDDIEEELFLDDNVMLTFIFSHIMSGLLTIICEVENIKSLKMAFTFAQELIPKKPKIHTHATAMALIGTIDR